VLDGHISPTILSTDPSSWLCNNRVSLAFGYYSCDNKDKTFVANCSFTERGHSPHIKLIIFIRRVSAPIQLDAWVCIATTTCSVD
jgi:hypothetical protein